MLWLDHKRQPLRAAASMMASCAAHVVIAAPLALCVTLPGTDRTPPELELVAVQIGSTAGDPAGRRPDPPPALPTPTPALIAKRRTATGTLATTSPRRRAPDRVEPESSASLAPASGDEAADGDDMRTPRSTIRISRAWYGWNSPSCLPVDRTSLLAEACDGRAHCEFAVSNRALGGDPCVDVPKGLQVLWDCIDEEGASEEQVTKRADPAVDEGQRLTFDCP